LAGRSRSKTSRRRKKKVKKLAILLCVLAMAAVELLAPAISQSATTTKSNKGIIVLRQGSQTVYFPTLRGYVLGVSGKKRIKPEDIKEIRFSSNRVGWGKKSVAVGPFNVTKKRAYIKVVGPNCERLPTPNNDVGQWAVVLQNGKVLWLNLDQWKFSGLPAKRVKTSAGADLIQYGDYRQESMKFDPAQKSLRVDFNSNVLSGLMELGIDTTNVDRIVWNSDKVGWMDSSIMFTVLEQDSCSRFFGNFSNMPNADQGAISVRMKDGSHIWLNTDMWIIQGGTIIKTVTGAKLIKYGDPLPPTMEFDCKNKSLRVKFNSDVLAGMVDLGIDPNKVTGIFWNSDLVGWLDGSDVSAPLQKDTSGNYFSYLTNMPDWDKGNVSVRLQDGSHRWINIDSWLYQGATVTLDHSEGQLEYHF
jgi:hypothetical protein